MSQTKKQRHSLDMQIQIVEASGGYTSDGTGEGRYIIGTENIYTGTRAGLAYALRHLAYTDDAYGIWKDNDVYYVDNVIAIHNLGTAKVLGNIYKQIAIYDREAKKDIIL